MLKVYLCAFKQRCYLEEAKICIRSLRTNGMFKGPVYLFTDMEDDTLSDVEVIKTSCECIPLAASFRVRLFYYIKNINKNDIFLYLDTDIVVLKPLPSFDTIDNKIQVYGYTSRNQNEPSFSGFITEDPYFTSKMAICSGILLFRPSVEVIKVFDEIYEMYQKLIKENKINACWEQPSLCYKLIEHDCYVVSLNDYVHEERRNTPLKDTVVFNHFCGLRGETRYAKMNHYLSDYHNDETSVHIDH